MKQEKKFLRDLINNKITISRKSGFTLIELLVVTAIIMVVTSIGVAAYQNFNDKRALEKAADDLKMNLRLVQSKAVNNEKDTSFPSCDAPNVLKGWYADFNTLTIYCRCGEADSGNTTELVDLDINDDGTPDITLTYSGIISGIILFKALGGTNLGSNVTINLSAAGVGNTATVRIFTSGDIQ